MDFPGLAKIKREGELVALDGYDVMRDTTAIQRLQATYAQQVVHQQALMQNAGMAQSAGVYKNPTQPPPKPPVYKTAAYVPSLFNLCLLWQEKFSDAWVTSEALAAGEEFWRAASDRLSRMKSPRFFFEESVDSCACRLEQWED